MGLEFSVSIAVSICSPTQSHEPGAGDRLPCNIHAPDQEGWLFQTNGPHQRCDTDPAFWIGAEPQYTFSILRSVNGISLDQSNQNARFQWVKAPTSAELTQVTHTIAHRVGRFLQRQGLLERDAQNSYLTGDETDDDPMTQLLGSSITYRIAVGSQAGRKVFTLQTLPAGDRNDPYDNTVGKVAGFSLHAGVAAKAHQRKKRERLCRYITRPAVSEKRLSLTSGGNIRYQLKTPYRNGTTHVIFIPGFLPSTLRASLRLFKIAPDNFVNPWTAWPNWRP
jgi:hypothetical protein